MKLLVMLAASAGCGAKESKCSAVVDRVFEVAPRDLASTPEDLSDLRGVMVHRCSEDGWPEAAKSCVLNAGDSDQMLACWSKHLSHEQYGRLTRATQPLRQPRSTPPPVDKLMAAHDHILDLVERGFPNWSTGHPNKDCPETLDELRGGSAVDPWGHAYVMYCGIGVPFDIKTGFGVMSFGPDGVDRSGDEVRSWFPRPRANKVHPDEGPPAGGKLVRVRGTGFLGDGRGHATPEKITARFGDSEGEVILVSDDTELIVKVPPGKLGDTVDVQLFFGVRGGTNLMRGYSYRAP